jgi:hypothetical protein
MYSRALPHSIILRVFWAASSIVSIIKLHTSTRMFQTNTMQAFNYYINVFVFIAATCIAILGLLFVKSHQVPLSFRISNAKPLIISNFKRKTFNTHAVL